MDHFVILVIIVCEFNVSKETQLFVGQENVAFDLSFFFFEIYFKAPLLGDCLDIFSLLVAVVVMGFLLVGETMVDLLLLALIPSVFFVLFLSDSNRKRQLLYTFN